MCVETCSFREPSNQIGADPSVGNGDVDNNDASVEFKPKTEPDSPSHHQSQCGHHQSSHVGVSGGGASSQSISGSSGPESGSEPHRMTSSHLLTNHQPSLPLHYEQVPAHPQHAQQQLHHGYGMAPPPAACAMGLEGLDAAAAASFAAAAASQHAAAAAASGRSFTPFGLAPSAHRFSYFDAVRQTGFDSM